MLLSPPPSVSIPRALVCFLVNWHSLCFFLVLDLCSSTYRSQLSRYRLEYTAYSDDPYISHIILPRACPRRVSYAGLTLFRLRFHVQGYFVSYIIVSVLRLSDSRLVCSLGRLSAVSAILVSRDLLAHLFFTALCLWIYICNLFSRLSSRIYS